MLCKNIFRCVRFFFAPESFWPRQRPAVPAEKFNSPDNERPSLFNRIDQSTPDNNRTARRAGGRVQLSNSERTDFFTRRRILIGFLDAALRAPETEGANGER